MRTLVIGVPLPHVSFDNYSFISAPSLADYPRAVVQMEAVSHVVDEAVLGAGEHTTFGGLTVVNGVSSTQALGLADLLSMRRREAEWCLARGGVAVCFGYPDVSQAGIQAMEEWRRWSWLPAPDGFSYERDLLPGFGRPGDILADETHPFAEYGQTFADRLAYRLYVNEAVPTFADVAGVFLRSGGGLAVGVELRVREGSIVILPPMPGMADDERVLLAQTLFQCLERWQNRPAPGAPECIRKEIS
jgi:hypothetical protein